MADNEDMPVAETIHEQLLEDRPSVRDRIVLLGRRAAGKTVYLSVLYERYFKSLDGMTMKARSGNVHSELMRVVDGLRRGVWPPATLELRHCELDIEFRGERRSLVALDYPGEVFRQAFVENVTQRPGPASPEAESLIRHIDAAAAVLILIDPASVCGDDVDATVDDEYGITQAVEYLRGSPGGDEVPVVLVYTKSDRTNSVITRHGGLASFTVRRLPALARTLKKVPMFQVSAVQCARNAEGQPVPTRKSKPVNLEMPLVMCLNALHAQDRAKRELLSAAERRAAVEARLRQDEERERRSGRILAAVVASLVVVTGCIIALIWVLRG